MSNEIHRFSGFLDDKPIPASGRIVITDDRPDTIETKAWEVFRSEFKEGDQVVVEDGSGKFHWGKLKSSNEYITLTRSNGYSVDLDWNNLEFIAHDGFPVGRILKMTAEEAAERAKQTPAEIIRHALEKEPEKPQHVGMGCPYLMSPIWLTNVFNRGNSSREFWYSPANEVLEFRSADGAVLHNYFTDHLFLMD